MRTRDAILDDLIREFGAELQKVDFAASEEGRIVGALLCRIYSHLDALKLLRRGNFPLEAEIVLRSSVETLIWVTSLVRDPSFLEAIQSDDAHSRSSIARLLQEEGEAGDSTVVEFYARLPKDQRTKVDTKDTATSGDMRPLYVIFKQLSAMAAHPSKIALERHFAFSATGEITHLQPMPLDADWNVLLRYSAMFTCLASDVLAEWLSQSGFEWVERLAADWPSA